MSSGKLHAARPSSFARDVAGTATTNVFLVCVGGVGGILLARALGPAERGHLVTIVQWPALLGTLVSLGITQAVTYRIGESPDDSGRTVGTATWAAIGSGLLVSICGIWLAPHLGRRADVDGYLTVLFALTPAYILAGLWNSALQAVDILRFNITRAVQPLVYTAAVIGLFITSKLSLATASTALVVALLLSWVVAWGVSRARFRLWERPSVSSLRRLYAYGLPVFVSGVPRLLNVRLDLLLLSVLASVPPADLGVYAAAASLTWFVVPLPSAFGTVAFPRLARRDDADRSDVQRRSIVGAVILAVAATALVAATGPFLVRTLLGDEYRSAVRPLLLLLPGAACLAVNQVLGDILRGGGRPARVATAEGVAAVLTCVGLVATVPRYGINGAAVVSSAAYACTTVLLSRALRRTSSEGPTASMVIAG